MTLRLKGQPYRPVCFVQVALYRFVRHPIMLGVLIGFLATPYMSVGHLRFAAATTGDDSIGIFLEDRDTRQALGETYERYRRETPMIVPLLTVSADATALPVPAGVVSARHCPGIAGANCDRTGGALKA